MPIKTITYNILISCPGDIVEEVDVINDVITQFNELYASSFHITLKTRHWSKSSYPASGKHPQDILNEQFVKDCDAAIAIFWTRFGTPTDKYGSGSEEEISIMLDSDKQVFLYFSERQIPPDKISTDQLNRVRSFRDNYHDKGLYCTYTSLEEFRSLLLGHLTKYFLSLSDRSLASDSKEKPLLCLRADNCGEICDYAMVQDWIPLTYEIDNSTHEKLKQSYERINNLHLKAMSKMSTSSPLFTLCQPVSLEDDVVQVLQKCAAGYSIELSSDFFSLGGLRWNNIPSDLYGHRELIGTEEEKLKYRTIMKLYHDLYDSLGRKLLGDQYRHVKGIHLLLDNHGTAFDEDVEVELKISKENYYDFRQFEAPDAAWLTWIDSEDDPVTELFELTSTSTYHDYSSSTKNRRSMPFIPYPLMRDRELKEYRHRLNELFIYEVFEEDDYYIIRITFDYIKQHTIVSFPTMLFFSQLDRETAISYKIISKHTSDVFASEIKIKPHNSPQQS